MSTPSEHKNDIDIEEQNPGHTGENQPQTTGEEDQSPPAEELESLEPIDIDALMEERNRLEEERDQLKDQLLRARAEFDNFRKRMARDSEQIKKTAAAELIRDLLTVADNLELALEHAADPDDNLAKGIHMVAKQFTEILQKSGLEPIPSQGEFDPNVHEAIMQQPSEEHPPNHIVTEFQRGYRLGEKVLRPSKVVVSSGPPGQDETSQDETSKEK